MFNYESKDTGYLGKTPKHISKEQIFDYFIYTFEYMWSAPAFNVYGNNVVVHYKALLESLKSNHELTIGQQWWALVFFALKDLSEDAELTYAKETILFVINRIHTLSNEELEHYANIINDGLSEQVYDVMTVRPLELSNLESQSIGTDVFMDTLLKNKDAFINIFKENLVIDDIDMMYLNRILVNDKKINEQFSDFWSTFNEMYMGLVVAMKDIYGKSHPESEGLRDEHLQDLNLTILLLALKNHSKIDQVKNQLLALTKSIDMIPQ